jgi:hypothetical protein
MRRGKTRTLDRSMTAELAPRFTLNQRLAFFVRCGLGVLVLLPAFVVWLQLAFLENIARSTGEDGWHSFVILLATILYLGALVAWMVNRKTMPIRDSYLIGYCVCIAGLLAYASSGNFFHQIKLYDFITALGNHLDALFYVALPVAFSLDRLMMLLRGRRERSNF